jgi:hypothetical protein
MKKNQKLSERQVKAFLATENPPSALIAAGWTPSALRAAGLTPSALIAAGWTPSDLRAAGWTPSDLRAAGWTPSDLRAAGWTKAEIKEAEEEWDSIPVIPKLYTKLLADIKAKRRLHDQKTWGPECDPGANVCGTPMCTAGHLVNIAGEIGYKLRAKYDWRGAARLIHMKNRPDAPPQNFGSIPQEFALAYIEQRAEEEK